MYRVGDYVTIKKEYSKYYICSENMIILDAIYPDDDIFSILYMVEYSVIHHEGEDPIKYKMALSPNCIELSKSHIRENKIDKILGDV